MYSLELYQSDHVSMESTCIVIAKQTHAGGVTSTLQLTTTNEVTARTVTS